MEFDIDEEHQNVTEQKFDTFRSAKKLSSSINSCSVPNFNIAHVNIQSIRANLTQLKTLLKAHTFEYDVIAISETNLNSNAHEIDFLLEGYEIFRCDRRIGKDGRTSNIKGGGVALYVKTTHRANQLVHLQFNDLRFESVWITINVSGLDYVIGVLYNPNVAFANPFINCLESALVELNSQSSRFVICGDFNINAHDLHSMHTKDLLSTIDAANA